MFTFGICRAGMFIFMMTAPPGVLGRSEFLSQAGRLPGLCSRSYALHYGIATDDDGEPGNVREDSQL
jgi:hypothetical protein